MGREEEHERRKGLKGHGANRRGREELARVQQVQLLQGV